MTPPPPLLPNTHTHMRVGALHGLPHLATQCEAERPSLSYLKTVLVTGLFESLTVVPYCGSYHTCLTHTRSWV